MKNKLMFGVLVKNYDEAIDFYSKKLGFVVLEDNPMGDDRFFKSFSPCIPSWARCDRAQGLY